MIQNLKALIVILGLSAPVWWLIQRLWSDLLPPDVLRTRRWAWLGVTAVAQLSPNIWLYALAVTPLMVWAGRRDPNPPALFMLLMFAVPPVAIPIPAVVINQLFDLSHLRIMAVALLLPALARDKAQGQGMAPASGWDPMRAALWCFGALIIALYIPFESPTNSLRRCFLFWLDTWLIFRFYAELGRRPGTVADVVGAWLMAGMLMAAVALFESLRSWLLYTGIGDAWGDPNVFAYLMRGSSLRAQASAGHSLALGYFLAISWGFFLYYQRLWPQRWLRWSAGALVLGGLWATLSRGPWLTAFAITVLMLLLNPRGAGSAVKALAGLAASVLLVLMSPFGEQVMNYLPFVGKVDSGNVDYRQRLFDTAWPLILRNPWGGNPDVLTDLESLRQGQGIIDLMNGYIQIALFYGLGGLLLFCALLTLASWRSLASWWAHRSQIGEDPNALDAAWLGACLCAVMLGSAFFIATASYGTATFLLAALCSSYWQASRSGAGLKPVPSQMAWQRA